MLVVFRDCPSHRDETGTAFGKQIISHLSVGNQIAPVFLTGLILHGSVLVYAPHLPRIASRTCKASGRLRLYAQPGTNSTTMHITTRGIQALRNCSGRALAGGFAAKGSGPDPPPANSSHTRQVLQSLRSWQPREAGSPQAEPWCSEPSLKQDSCTQCAISTKRCKLHIECSAYEGKPDQSHSASDWTHRLAECMPQLETVNFQGPWHQSNTAWCSYEYR